MNYILEKKYERLEAEAEYFLDLYPEQQDWEMIPEQDLSRLFSFIQETPEAYELYCELVDRVDEFNDYDNLMKIERFLDLCQYVKTYEIRRLDKWKKAVQIVFIAALFLLLFTSSSWFGIGYVAVVGIHFLLYIWFDYKRKCIETRLATLRKQTA